MSPYQNTRTRSGNLLALIVHDILRPKLQYTSQAIVMYTQKPASVFIKPEPLAHAADDQCSMSRSLECVSYYIELPKLFYSDSGISVFS